MKNSEKHFLRQHESKENSLDEASRSATDIAQLQEIIRQQAALKTLQISID